MAPGHPDSAVASLRQAYEQRARAELDAADTAVPGSGVVRWRGCLTPAVAVVKGLPGPAEASGGAAVSGADGAAIARALESLGHDPAQAFYTLSRPALDIGAEQRAQRVRAHIEAVDAPLVIALDAEAAQDIARGFHLPDLAMGTVVRVAGRRLVACGGLEAALGDERAKGRVWRQLKNAIPEPPVY